jgi:hypothetical protein
MRRLSSILFLTLAVTACGSKSPSSPSSAESSNVLQGQALSAVDGTAAPRVQVHLSGKAPVTADGDGRFTINVGEPGAFNATIRGNAVVERQTIIVGPGAEPVRLSLIPADFDLTAFDEMFRTGDRLMRWTSRPSLVLIATVMSYRSGPGNEYVATGEQLTQEEVDQMIAHLTEGLALLTGNTFTSFESISVERPESGARVNVERNGRIVVGRYSGIQTWANTIGYGQWTDQPNGTVTSGAMFLDRDFDRGDARRRLLRIHELGHALGAQHVRTRISIMNPAIGPEPTAFDRAAAMIAFQRPPGNHAPDIDPAGSNRGFSVAEGGGVTRQVFCR